MAEPIPFRPVHYYAPGGPQTITDLRIADLGEAYMAAVAEYVIRGGNPDNVMARCLVCEQVNVGPGHRTPLGYECSFGEVQK